MDRGFVLTDERLHTGVANIHAVGDIVPGLQLAHRGFAQGVFLAEEIAGLNPVAIVESGIPRVTYSDPEIASVGVTEAKAAELYGADQVQTYEYNLAGNGKSQILGTTGFVKLVRRKDGPVVGVHMLGARVGELIGGGPADRQLGGLPRGRRLPGARPPHPERGGRRGLPRAGRQAAARAQLTGDARSCLSPSRCRLSARASPRAPSPAG